MPLADNAAYAAALYREIQKIAQTDAWLPPEKTMRLYALLRDFFDAIAEEAHVALLTQYTRIAYVCHKQAVPQATQRYIYEFRKQANDLNYARQSFAPTHYALGLYACANAVAAVTNVPITPDLAALLPEAGFYQFTDIVAKNH